MTALFQRRVRLTIGTLQIEGLRTQFKVKKTLKKDPNECEISVFNLSSAHRTALQAQGTPFVLEAGYGGQLTRVFSGTVRYGDSVREGADWISKIQSGDGEQAFRFATVSESFAKGTPAAAVFSKVAQSLKAHGVDINQAVTNVQARLTAQFAQGYTAHGKSSTEIDSLLRGQGLEWSLQDGKLQVLPIGQPVPGAAIVLNASSGLIGSPEHGTPSEKGATPFLKVKSLLQPTIAPGSAVRVESIGATGNFRADTVTHTGDSFGQEFYTEMELRPL